MNFFRSMEIDPTCKFSPPQSQSEGISFYGFSAPRRFHATKTQRGHDPPRSGGIIPAVSKARPSVGRPLGFYPGRDFGIMNAAMSDSEIEPIQCHGIQILSCRH